MTRRELVKAAIAHKETDRVPYCINFTGEGEDELKKIIGTTTVRQYIDNDVFTIGAPWWHWLNLGPEWKLAETPTTRAQVFGAGNYDNFFNTLRTVRENSDKYILVTIYGSHFEKAWSARDIHNFLTDMVAEPEITQKLLNRIIDRNLVMLENILGMSEIDGILLGSDWGTQQDLFMSPETWEEMIMPGEKKEYDLIHSYGKDVWVHSCGNIERVIPQLIKIGLNVLNPVQPEAMDLDRLKSDFGSKLTFWGGITTQTVLPFGTPDEVKTEARRVRSILSKNGGYIFGPSQEIQGDVPAKNIAALVEVAKEKK